MHICPFTFLSELATEYDKVNFTCFEEIINLIIAEFSNRFTYFVTSKTSIILFTQHMTIAIENPSSEVCQSDAFPCRQKKKKKNLTGVEFQSFVLST